MPSARGEPTGVVEADPFSDCMRGAWLAFKAMTMYALLFQGPDHAFNDAALLWAVRRSELRPKTTLGCTSST